MARSSGPDRRPSGIPNSRARAVLPREVVTPVHRRPSSVIRPAMARMPWLAARPVPRPTRMPDSTWAAAASPAARQARCRSSSTAGRLCETQLVSEIAPGIEVIDTRMWGWEAVTSAYLVRGDAPAIVDTGPQTSAATVGRALADRGIGPGDLAWIVLTHIHLDHCGASGHLARSFPDARVVVHPRGARHIAEPERLIAGSAAVYGAQFRRYGGLEPVPAERIDAVADGDRVRIGPQRELVAIEAPGHARHQHAFLDTATGTVLAGDALGVRLQGGGLFPALPPPDVDMEAGRASVAAIAERKPTAVGLGHFGAAGDPAEVLEQADALWAAMAVAGRSGWRNGGSVAAVGEAVEAAWPAAARLGPRAHATLTELAWIEATAEGVARWAQRQEREGGDSAPDE